MVVDTVRTLFASRFGPAPAQVAEAPGRVNLIGEHVDYAEGFVLPMAIERSTAVALRPSSGPTRIVSEGFGEVVLASTQPIQPLAGDGAWANYVLGPLRELHDLGLALPELEIAVASDVSPGGGVSSSAALEVATTVAALAIAGRTLDGLAIARLCQRAEHRYAGTPCGIMDMTVSANARAGHALLLDCRSLAMRHVPMPAGATLLVVDSGVRHRLSEGGYASRRKAVEDAATRLGVKTLRDATPAMLGAVELPEESARCARHVISEIGRTVEAAEALAAGDVRRFGQLMAASHASLRDDFRVSVEELDLIVATALALPGVHGARMTGGGFGGAAIVLAEDAATASVRAAIEAAFRQRFGRAPTAFATHAAAGAGLR